MPGLRFVVCAVAGLTTAGLLSTRLVTAQAGQLTTPDVDPPSVAKSLEALDVLLGRYLATLQTSASTVPPAGRAVATRARSTLTNLRELSKKWPAQSPLDYRVNLDRTVRRLQLTLEGPDQAPAPETLEALAEDLEAKLEHCLKSGGKLGGSVTVRVRTVRLGQEVANWQIFYLPRLLDTAGGVTADRFPQLSSPTQERIVPGRYVMWSTDPTSGRVGAKTVVKIGEGRQDLMIDLTVPGP